MKPFYFLAIVVVALISITGCASAPAAFELVSLDIIPAVVTAGEAVTVTAQVKNVGGSQGVYAATLTVDGAKVESKDISVAAGVVGKQAFSLTKDKAGTYSVSVGGKSSTFEVKPKMVAKEVELKYDDGSARDSISAYVPYLGGHIVDFSPPVSPFTIKKIRIAGVIFPSALKAIEGKKFDVEIWDKDQKVLYSVTYPYTKFIVGATTWVDFEVPDIKVNDNFYAHIYTDSPFPGLHIGADDSVINKHSETTIRTTGGAASILAKWPYDSIWGWFGDKSKVNWMIRVVGTYNTTE